MEKIWKKENSLFLYLGPKACFSCSRVAQRPACPGLPSPLPFLSRVGHLFSYAAQCRVAPHPAFGRSPLPPPAPFGLARRPSSSSPARHFLLGRRPCTDPGQSHASALSLSLGSPIGRSHSLGRSPTSSRRRILHCRCRESRHQRNPCPRRCLVLYEGRPINSDPPRPFGSPTEPARARSCLALSATARAAAPLSTAPTLLLLRHRGIPR